MSLHFRQKIKNKVVELLGNEFGSQYTSTVLWEELVPTSTPKVVVEVGGESSEYLIEDAGEIGNALLDRQVNIVIAGYQLYSDGSEANAIATRIETTLGNHATLDDLLLQEIQLESTDLNQLDFSEVAVSIGLTYIARYRTKTNDPTQQVF